MSYDLAITTYSKLILLGEHSVIRGCPAIAFPNNHYMTELFFKKTNNILKITAIYNDTIQDNAVIIKLIKIALEKIDRSYDLLLGELEIKSNIPQSKGLGSSAAICVAICKWLKWYFDIELEIYKLSKTLEDYFHGTSSGLDIALALNNKHILFRQGNVELLDLKWHPKIKIIDSQSSTKTKACVNQVQKLFVQNKKKAFYIDNMMKKAVFMAYNSLTHSGSINELAQAIKIGANCFGEWGLVSDKTQELISKLEYDGALAVKPTGSGGGMLLALYE